MKRKMLALLIPALLVTGVGCTSVHKMVDKEAAEEKVKSEDYKDQLASLMKDFKKESAKLDKILNGDKTLEEKEKEFKVESEALVKLTKEVDKLDPGEKYKDVQAKLYNAMSLVRVGVTSIQGGLEYKENRTIQSGGESLLEASQLITEADKLMRETK
ncbi:MULTISPECIES: tungsten formylmethanofuran dehydrogenase [Bacillus]|uniref:Tungsten formylmethanofuran dehydrogenase n=1 Tax=Bacillus pseudomycoides TaxID=64104 RepID=A0AAJ1Z7Q9_9BACI|nr:tungsten formylmethanofuran dehydrogenase [Bacillus pseudomycoides]MCR8859442.1 tungsten formylmethanofuran dehydrogenase [Bacillus pseudomycoides]MDR4329763.1 tungsten formylmethanofuran dehydrogenase [Bacillus pseudomycoides]MED1476439.1 tungsten formylmethanofuran dehydrogenase [Bacillus pseudomycoides]MED1538989.1 tungsten formylmethanofuran dehydrogenase [Bacillus pseudomycoides]PEF25910.1 tungsten formylmethanofuran dehydrogenase [Bacillus pseudomycoides]